MSKEKKLIAIHYDPFGKVTRTTIATGETGDFAFPVGFQIIDITKHDAASDEEEENGTYPVMLDGEWRNLEGKLKTLADATFTNKDQREAFKSMIAEILWSNFSKRVEETIGMYKASKMQINVPRNITD